MEQQKRKFTKEEGFWASAFGFLIIYLFVASIWGIFPFNNKYNEDCVNECVYDNEYCLNLKLKYAQSGVSYLLKEDYESCQLDLESCISNCEP